jgi:hypothetical protein
MPEVLDPLQDAGQVGKEHPLPNVDAKRDIFDLAALLVTEFNEGGKQRWRKVINAEIPDVFEAFQRVRLPRSREAGDNHELESWHLDPLRINEDDVTGLRSPKNLQLSRIHARKQQHGARISVQAITRLFARQDSDLGTHDFQVV